MPITTFDWCCDPLPGGIDEGLAGLRRIRKGETDLFDTESTEIRAEGTEGFWLESRSSVNSVPPRCPP